MAPQNFLRAAESLPVNDAGEPGRQTLDQLFSVTYEELRRLAYSVKQGDPSNTLSPTTLVKIGRAHV